LLHSKAATLQGELSRNRCYREDQNLARWISDVEIKKNGAEVTVHVEKTKIMLGEQGKLLIERLRPTFYNFIFIFPESTSHDFLL
jgi:ribosomal protein S3